MFYIVCTSNVAYIMCTYNNNTILKTMLHRTTPRHCFDIWWRWLKHILHRQTIKEHTKINENRIKCFITQKDGNSYGCGLSYPVIARLLHICQKSSCTCRTCHWSCILKLFNCRIRTNLMNYVSGRQFYDLLRLFVI